MTGTVGSVGSIKQSPQVEKNTGVETNTTITRRNSILSQNTAKKPDTVSDKAPVKTGMQISSDIAAIQNKSPDAQKVDTTSGTLKSWITGKFSELQTKLNDKFSSFIESSNIKVKANSFTNFIRQAKGFSPEQLQVKTTLGDIEHKVEKALAGKFENYQPAFKQSEKDAIPHKLNEINKIEKSHLNDLKNMRSEFLNPKFLEIFNKNEQALIKNTVKELDTYITGQEKLVDKLAEGTDKNTFSLDEATDHAFCAYADNDFKELGESGAKLNSLGAKLDLVMDSHKEKLGKFIQDNPDDAKALQKFSISPSVPFAQMSTRRVMMVENIVKGVDGTQDKNMHDTGMASLKAVSKAAIQNNELNRLNVDGYVKPDIPKQMAERFEKPDLVKNPDQQFNIQDCLYNPKVSQTFTEFAKKEWSTENIEFMQKLGKAIEKQPPQFEDFQSLFDNYISLDAPKQLNVKGGDVASLKNVLTEAQKEMKAGKEPDMDKIMKKLDPISMSVFQNVTDTYTRFMKSEEAATLNPEIMSIKKLPVREQLHKLNELKGKTDVNSFMSSVISGETERLTEKFVPKVPVDSPAQMKDFISNFKEATKSPLINNKIAGVYQGLEKLDSALNDKTGKPEDKIASINSLKIEINTFLKNSPGSKADWVVALDSQLSRAIDEIVGKEEGKDALLFAGTQKGKKLYINKETGTFATGIDFKNISTEDLKQKASEFARNSDQKGNFAWSLATLPKEDAMDVINKALLDTSKDIKIGHLRRLTQSIYDGMKEGLEVKASDSISDFTLNGETFRVTGKLSSGAFGTAYKCESDSGKVMVMKTFGQKEHALAEVEAHRYAVGRKENEHENVTNFVGFIEVNIESKESEPTTCCTIMEFVDGGDVKKLLNNINDYTDNNALSHTDSILVRQYLAKGMVDGMIHINETRDMMHLDLKPDNIFYDKSNGKVKIGDMGLAGKNQEKNNDTKGTPGYFSPQVIGKEKYDKSADIYSTGLVLQELVTGKKVFSEDNQLVDNILPFSRKNEDLRQVKDTKGNISGSDPTSLGKVVNNTVKTDASERLKFSELRKQEFFTDPIGSDERAQLLLNAIYDVEAMKKALGNPKNFDTKAAFKEKIKEFSSLW